jgi:hypothetical protein
MKDVDLQGLTIVEQIKRCHAMLVPDVGPVANIFMVFAHDLVIHFSSILIHRLACEYYTDNVDFPWLNKGYALSPCQMEAEVFQVPEQERSLRIHLRQLSLANIALGEALPFGFHHNRLISRCINLLGSYKPFAKVFLPQRQRQFEALQELLISLCVTFEISGQEAVRYNWERYLLLHTTNKQDVLSEQGLILGTRNNLQNRKLAVNYLQQGKEVVAVTHGEVANAVMDEPPFGYSERTLCSTLVDYGDFDEDGIYNTPWVLPRRKVSRTSISAQAVHRPTDQIVLPRQKQYRALYIPTTYAGNGLYGPFHAYEDVTYRRWQRALFNKLPELTFKAHPKSRSAPLKHVNLEERQLEECITEYDLLIFDYFATGAMLALVSDKPVIYCDIGLRQLHPKFLRDVKERCEYVKIDLDYSVGPQLEEAFSGMWAGGVPRSNQAIMRYVRSDGEAFSWFRLFRSSNNCKLPSV